ncbi:MAG: CAP domain-containing protein [Eubacteriales bacterium]
MKKIKSILLILVMTLALVIAPSLSASAASSNLSYKLIYCLPQDQVNSDYISQILNRLYTVLGKGQGWFEIPVENMPQPTQNPGPEPTPAPTEEPVPTQVPSPEPTKAPVPTQAPSPKPSQLPSPQPTGNPSTAYQLSSDEQRMVNLVNSERQKAGLAPLKVDLDLSRVARIKSQDMRDNNYFSHTSPTYGSPFDMMRSFGISYRTAGENIALHGSVESAHNGLMNSDGHRANILSPNFTHIGIGIVDGRYYTQMFIGK